MTHLKGPWCWERLRAGGEGNDRGWDGWMASLTWWTWVWVSSRSWWRIAKAGMLVSQRVGHDWATELNWTKWSSYGTISCPFNVLVTHHSLNYRCFCFPSYSNLSPGLKKPFPFLKGNTRNIKNFIFFIFNIFLEIFAANPSLVLFSGPPPQPRNRFCLVWGSKYLSCLLMQPLRFP